MNRRRFIATLFIAGLITQLGLSAKPTRVTREPAPIECIHIHGEWWSGDGGETWTAFEHRYPPNGIKVARYNRADGSAVLIQPDPDLMPAYYASPNPNPWGGNIIGGHFRPHKPYSHFVVYPHLQTTTYPLLDWRAKAPLQA